jgi:hypothetical protein
MDPAMKEAFDFLLERRGIETPCPTCSGLGVRTYGSTAGWMGGMGGQAITSGVCDKCWGSGDKHRSWPSWKELKAIRDENKRLKADVEKRHERSLKALLAKHGVDIDDLPDSRDPFLFGPPVYLGDDEELIKRSRQ